MNLVVEQLPLTNFYNLNRGICSDDNTVLPFRNAKSFPDYGFTPQSGTTADNTITQVSSSSKHENVAFSDQTDPYLYDVAGALDPTRTLQDSSDATLDHFFKRPIKIHEEEWGTGALLYFAIDPWSLYLDNPRVSNRLSNFNLLRCNLKVKIVINGNGFQYGRAIASYLPFDVHDTLSVNAILVPEDIVQASQTPHVYLDPTTSQGGELKLPFFWYRNYFNIPTSEWSEMGTLYVRSINALKHANGAADKVTVNVFAWAEDVALSVLTSVEPDTLSPQMGKENIEANTKGFISGPATALSKAAAMLGAIPQIAPYAMATSAALQGIAGAAKALGYSRPTVTKNPEPYRPTNLSSLATTTTPDTAQKLTLDDQQELTIDPRISGVGPADPLCIRDIACRESYLTTFTWAIGTTPETLLFNSRISPVIWTESGSTAYHFPACCMAAMPFKYWTGSMKFRFQVVCSAFHKGRLKIVYDPNWLATNEYNVNYLHIIDIADQTDFSIEVGNGQNKTLLDHHNPGLDSVTQLYSTTAYTSKEEGNGVLGIYVVNELTTPNSTVNNDVEVNVFVSMGDDFEVFVPDDHFQKFVYKAQSGIEENFSPQSGPEALIPEAQNTDEPSAPQQSQMIALGPTKTDGSLINKVFTGESVCSFRALLKRYNLWTTMGTIDTVPIVLSTRMAHFPFLRGNVADAVHEKSGGTPYNYCNTVMLHWVTLCFSGWRGGIRYKFTPRGGYDVANPPVCYVQRHSDTLGIAGFTEVPATVPTFGNSFQVAHAAVIGSGPNPNFARPMSGVKGQCLSQGQINSNVEFESPFYSDLRFLPGKQESWTGTTNLIGGVDFRYFADGTASSVFDIHVATAEDYQPYFWTGMPRMYFEPVAPTV